VGAGLAPRAQRVARPKQGATPPSPISRPRGVKQRPHRDCKQQCEQHPFEGEREGGVPQSVKVARTRPASACSAR